MLEIVGGKLIEIVDVRWREVRGRQPRVIERPEQRERVQSRRFETGAQVRRRHRRRSTWHDARMGCRCGRRKGEACPHAAKRTMRSWSVLAHLG